MECRGGLPLFDGAPASKAYLGHRLDLRLGEAAIFDAFESAVRRAVRKAEQSGIKIEVLHDLESLRAFHVLLCKTRKKHGMPPQPFDFFSCIHRHVLARKLGCVVLARVGSIPIAGAVYFHFGGTAIYKYGASDMAFQHLRANNLVMWEAIKIHSNNGFETLDFGRTSVINSGLQKFKLSWGASERQIEYVRQDLHSGSYVPNLGEPEGLYTQFLRLMPQPLLRLIGATLYKHAA
jgi:lipid II:glycine glycyltransferase (peptidoglycan interpeptide bridge formation enzyme)